MAERIPVPPASPEDWQRFMDKLEVMPSGCWERTGAALFSSGYAAFHLQGSTRRAHRVFYVWTCGELAEGEDLDHFCKNKACVRPHPDHVWPNTHKENVLRSGGPTAKNAIKTHSDSGHELDGLNNREERFSKQDARDATKRWRNNNPDKVAIANAKKRADREAVKKQLPMKLCERCGELFQPGRVTGRFCKIPTCVKAREKENVLKRKG